MAQATEQGEVTTIASATATSKSIRSTIPKGIVRQIKLNKGNRLHWFITAEDSQLAIDVEPVPAMKH